MLDGNEVEQPIGKSGKAIVDVSPFGVAKAEITWSEGGTKAGAFIEVDVVEILEKLAAKTDNKVDDALVGMVKSALGR